MILNNNNFDKFGFYQVGKHKFYSKLEAAHLRDTSGLPMTWNFNESVYSAQPWDIEPPQSLAELYRQRAQQLRDKYDYLVLWFSGGADSTNVLDSFIENNIKLDEVASYVNYEATGDRFNFLNGEVFNVAIPKIEEVKQKQPGINHTIIDLSTMIMDHFTAKETKFDWIYHMNGYLNPNNASKQDIKLAVPRWRDMIAAGKRVCFIHGIDKPRVNELNGKFYFRFVDMVDGAVSANVQILNRPWEFDELFYWTPDLPEIVIKQAHVLKRFLKQATSATPGITTENIGLVSTVFDKKLHWVTLDTVHHLIYPMWKPVLYQAKAPSLFFTPRDEWFFKLPDLDPAKYSWRVGLEHIWKITPDNLKKDPSKIEKGFKLFNSKIYEIGP
jgi:hypothetical protein